MYNYYDLATQSLAKVPSSITEAYYPLWVYSSGTVATAATAAGTAFLQKGSASPSSTSITLHILNSNWSSTQKFAFEASIYAGSSYTAYAELWDRSTTSAVTASAVSVANSGSLALVRSGQFTLTPGHNYAVTFWCNSTSADAYLTKAHLIAFLS